VDQEINLINISRKKDQVQRMNYNPQFVEEDFFNIRGERSITEKL